MISYLVHFITRIKTIIIIMCIAIVVIAISIVIVAVANSFYLLWMRVCHVVKARATEYDLVISSLFVLFV